MGAAPSHQILALAPRPQNLDNATWETIVAFRDSLQPYVNSSRHFTDADVAKLANTAVRGINLLLATTGTTTVVPVVPPAVPSRVLIEPPEAPSYCSAYEEVEDALLCYTINGETENFNRISTTIKQLTPEDIEHLLSQHLMKLLQSPELTQLFREHGAFDSEIVQRACNTVKRLQETLDGLK